jgi:hypothetical protein
VVEICSKYAEETEGLLTYDQFLNALKSIEREGSVTIEGPDPKVVEFMRILEEYRMKCEEEGNYLEAGRAHKQLEVLRIQEEKRQEKAIRVRQITERQDVQVTAFPPPSSSPHPRPPCSWHTTCSSVSSMQPGTSTWRSTTTWRRCTSSR